MKLALIPPTPQLPYARSGDIHFVLAQRVLSDEKYRQFYRRSRKFKILDNGAFERDEPLPTNAIFEAAKAIRADEIIAPDFPRENPSKTLKATRDFISVCSPHYLIMAVPHGRTVLEYVKSFDELSKLPGVNTIGVSILDLWKFKHSYRLRPMVVHYINKKLKNVVWENVHLLGLDEPIELYAYRGMGIRSVDTSLPFSLAYWKLTMRLIPIEHSRAPDWNSVDSAYHHRLLLENIRCLKKICKVV